MLRRFLKVGLILLLLTGMAACWAHRPRPKLTMGPDADALARRVMDAIGADAWRKLQRVVFTFRGLRYDWHVQEQAVWIGDVPERTIIDLETNTCRAESDSESISESTCRYRLARWNNDSFWLNPFGKLFDQGADRGLCTVNEGAPPWLCIQFNRGGDTPGDLYAIEVGADGRPAAWRMWVTILPIGGVHTVWRQWRSLPGDAWFAADRDAGIYTIPIEVIRVEP